MLRRPLNILIVLFIAFASIFLWEKLHSFNLFRMEDTKTTHNIVLKEMSALGKIELANFTFRDVVEQELKFTYLPNPKAVLIVQGNAIGCIDLTKVRAEDVATKDDTLVVHLPDPELCHYSIDHQHSRIYDTQYAFMNEQALLNEAYSSAQEKIKQSALDMGILEQTRKNANLVLKPILENISGKKVVLKYQLRATLDRPK